jgi:hypothetical protein
VSDTLIEYNDTLSENELRNIKLTAVYRVHSPKNTLFIKLENALKFTLKFTLSLLLHVSVYDHNQGAYTGAKLKLYLY